MRGKRYSIFILVIVLSALFLSFSSFAQTPTILTWKIPFYLEDEENGPFIDMIKEIIERSGEEYGITLYPAKRSVSYFKEDKMTILFPAMAPNLPKDIKYVQSEPYMQKKVYAFVKEDNPLPMNVKDLEGKKVGLVRGYSYPSSVTQNEKIHIDYAKNADMSMKKLCSGRIDVVLDDINVGKQAITDTEAKGVKYGEESIAHINVFFAFHDTPEGRKMEKSFSKAILDMKTEGVMRKYITRPNQRE